MHYIGILGLGYIGLPLALAFSKKNFVYGYDTNLKRIKNLNQGIDTNKEFSKKEIQVSNKLFFTNKITELKKCNIYIIAVPTPIF